MEGQIGLLDADVPMYVFCCADINECLLGTHNCEQLCSNTPGSFTCSCRSGYILNNDGQTCRVSELNQISICMY